MKKTLRNAILGGVVACTAANCAMDMQNPEAGYEEIGSEVDGLTITRDSTHTATLLRSMRGATLPGTYVRDTHAVVRVEGSISSIIRAYYVPGVPAANLNSYFRWTTSGYVPNLPTGSALLRSTAFSAASAQDIAINGGGVDFSRGFLLVHGGSMTETNLANNASAIIVPTGYDFRTEFVSPYRSASGVVTRKLKVTNRGAAATAGGCVAKINLAPMSQSGVRLSETRQIALQSLQPGESTEISISYNTGYFLNGFRMTDNGATAYIECPYFAGNDFATTAQYPREIVPATTAASTRF